MRLIYFLLLFIPSISCISQVLSQKEISVEAQRYLPKAIRELREFLLLKNDGHYPEQINKNLVWCLEAMKKRKFTTKVLSYYLSI